MSNQIMEVKVKELMELKRMKEELEAEIAAVEDEIKKVMGDEETLFAGAFNEHLSVILGVNKKEACEILALFGVSIPDYAQASEDALLDLLLEQLRVDTIVVHSRAAAAGGNAAGCRAVAPVRYCETPRLTTGAGDNFNAGFMLGQICGLSLEESLITAVSNSGYYVRNGQSPDLRSLPQYMEESAQLQP